MTARPARGTPEYDLWVAAIEVAIYPPLTFKGATTQVSTEAIAELRLALTTLGIDWRDAKEKTDAQKAERRRMAEERRAELERLRQERELL